MELNGRGELVSAPGHSTGASPPSRLSTRHEAIMNWLLLNPELSLRACADHFNYSQSWLSTLIHCDMFQAELCRRQADIASRVASSIPAKLAVVADVALGKLADMVEKSEDPEFILDAADKALHRMGYAPASARNPGGSPGALVQNTLIISSSDLADARLLMQNACRDVAEG